MISSEFLALLRCPLTLESLVIADSTLVGRLNAGIEAGTLLNRAGEAIDRALDSGLVNQGRTLAYPIRDEIPCLLVDEAIPLEQLS